MENDLLQVETEVKEMMTKTQAEYTSSGGDKAKVWDTIQKEVLVTGGKGNRLFVYSTQRGGIWGRVYRQIKHCIRGEGENIFFFFNGEGGGMGKGLRSDSKRTGSEGGKTGRHRRMQTIPFIVVIVL